MLLTINKIGYFEFGQFVFFLSYCLAIHSYTYLTIQDKVCEGKYLLYLCFFLEFVRRECEEAQISFMRNYITGQSFLFLDVVFQGGKIADCLLQQSCLSLTVFQPFKEQSKLSIKLAKFLCDGRQLLASCGTVSLHGVIPVMSCSLVNNSL